MLQPEHFSKSRLDLIIRMESETGSSHSFFAGLKSRLTTMSCPTSTRQLLAWIDEADGEYSRPIFASTLPYFAEAAFTLPANWFGLSPILLVGPLWASLLLAPQVSVKFNVRLFVAAVLFTIPSLVAWRSFLNGNTVLYKKFFLGKEAIILFPFISIAICYWLIENQKLFSMSLYPMWLWMLSLMLVLPAKNKTRRHRPCTKLKFSKYVNNKHFQAVPRILAKVAGDASLPSGDAAGSMAFGLTIALAGRIYFGILIFCFSCLGRVYYVVHHAFDTIAGGLATVLAYFVSTLLFGVSLTSLRWYHAVLMHNCFILLFLGTFNFNKKPVLKQGVPAQR